MRVRELVETLQKCDPEAVIIMAGPDSGGYDITSCLGVFVKQGGIELVLAATDKDYERAKRMFPSIVNIEGICEPDFYDAIRGRAEWPL